MEVGDTLAGDSVEALVVDSVDGVSVGALGEAASAGAVSAAMDGVGPITVASAATVTASAWDLDTVCMVDMAFTAAMATAAMVDTAMDILATAIQVTTDI